MFKNKFTFQSYIIKRFIRLQTSDKKNIKKNIEEKKKLAQSDDKVIKLSKKDDGSEDNLLFENNERNNFSKEFNPKVEIKIDKFAKKVYDSKLMAENINLIEKPLRTWELMKESIQESQINRLEDNKLKMLNLK